MDQFHMADLANYAANVPTKSKVKLQGNKGTGNNQDFAVECPKFNDLLLEKKEQPGLTQEQQQMVATLLSSMQIPTNLELSTDAQPLELSREENLFGIETVPQGTINMQVAREVQSKIQYPQKDVLLGEQVQKVLLENSEQMLEMGALQKEGNHVKEANVVLQAYGKSEASEQRSKEMVHTSNLVEQEELPIMQSVDVAYGQEEKVILPQQTKVQQTEGRRSTFQETMQVNSEKEIPQNLAKRIVEQSTKGIREFEIQIEPKNLGKVAVKLEYKNGEALISIVCTEPKTLELVKNHVHDIRFVVERNLQEDMMVFVDEKKAETFAQQEQGNSDAGRESEWERQKEKRKREAQVGNHRFLQELRLGLHV